MDKIPTLASGDAKEPIVLVDVCSEGSEEVEGGKKIYIHGYSGSFTLPGPTHYGCERTNKATSCPNVAISAPAAKSLLYKDHSIYRIVQQLSKKRLQPTNSQDRESDHPRSDSRGALYIVDFSRPNYHEHEATKAEEGAIEHYVRTTFLCSMYGRVEKRT